MSRSRKRTSRALIAVLAICLALGLVVWFHNVNQSDARDPQPHAGSPAAQLDSPVAAAPQAPATPPAPPVVVTQTPFGSAPLKAEPVVAQTPSPQSPSGPAAPSPATPAPAASTPAAASPSRTVSSEPLSADPLPDGKAAIESGHLLRGRTILNAALVSGTLSASQAQQAKQLIGKANATLILSPTRHPDDRFVSTYKVVPGDSLAKIAAKYDITWELLARMNGITDPRKLRAGQTLKVVQGPFSAVVNKSAFNIELWLGAPEAKQSLFVTSYSVGLGRDDSTPTGGWIVRPGGKLKNPKFWGAGDLPPMEADDPKNPLGEFWIALDGTDGNAVGKQSYGIHGTIEPESIGHMASLGCIRLRNDDVEMVYEMLTDGKSRVIVRD